MRHRKAGRKLNRNSSHRKALLKNLAIALIEQDIIRTTLPKAKELRKVIEPLITLGKEDTVANRRLAFSRLRSDSAVAKLFTEVSVNSKDRKGGYTRIIKVGSRMGDNASMALIELVDFNDVYVSDKPAKKRSRRRGGAKKTEEAPVAEVEAATEEVVEETPVKEAEQTTAATEEASAPEATDSTEDQKEDSSEDNKAD